MRQYIDIVKSILKNGVWKDTRTKFRTLATFGEVFRHDMSYGFPLLTTRKMPFKSLLVELEGFIHGITDKKWYQERGCKYWDNWANPKSVDKDMIKWQEKNCQKYSSFKECVQDSSGLRSKFQLENNDLGPIYGYQWRSFGEQYGKIDGDSYNYEWVDIPNGTPKGVNQLDSIVQTLKKNPNDRRMLCSAWNPNQMHIMALPPCHVLWHVVVLGDKLNLCWYQRSCDVPVGIPSNIASYATLLLLLAKESGLKPGVLQGILADAHIYENQIDAVKEQISRTPLELPTLELTHIGSIYDWTHKDIKLINYNSYPKLDMGEIAV